MKIHTRRIVYVLCVGVSVLGDRQGVQVWLMHLMKWVNNSKFYTSLTHSTLIPFILDFNCAVPHTEMKHTTIFQSEAEKKSERERMKSNISTKPINWYDSNICMSIKN